MYLETHTHTHIHTHIHTHTHTHTHLEDVAGEDCNDGEECSNDTQQYDAYNNKWPVRNVEGEELSKGDGRDNFSLQLFLGNWLFAIIFCTVKIHKHFLLHKEEMEVRLPLRPPLLRLGYHVEPKINNPLRGGGVAKGLHSLAGLVEMVES